MAFLSSYRAINVLFRQNIQTPMKFIDIGANLIDPMFKGIYRGKNIHQDDFCKVIERAKHVNVERIIITGGSLKESEDALHLAEKNDDLYCTVGCHPTRCMEFIQNDRNLSPEHYLDALAYLIQEDGMKKHKKIVAVGECGLDYDRLEFCPKEVQLKYFEMQFVLAEKSGLPVFLHNRNTGDDFVNVIRANRHRLPQGGVVHSFTGPWEEAKKLLDMDLYIGINGCSLKSQENLKVIAKLPLNRILLETDAPWCEIRPTHASWQHIKNTNQFSYDPKEKFQLGHLVKGRNEPCTIIQVAEVVAAIKGVEFEELAQFVYENSLRLFFKEK